MRYFEVAGGIDIVITEEEDSLVNKIKESSSVRRSKLNERDRIVAQRLVSRGVLNRKDIDEDAEYSVNSLNKVWRI